MEDERAVNPKVKRKGKTVGGPAPKRQRVVTGVVGAPSFVHPDALNVDVATAAGLTDHAGRSPKRVGRPFSSEDRNVCEKRINTTLAADIANAVAIASAAPGLSAATAESERRVRICLESLQDALNDLAEDRTLEDSNFGALLEAMNRPVNSQAPWTGTGIAVVQFTAAGVGHRTKMEFVGGRRCVALNNLVKTRGEDETGVFFLHHLQTCMHVWLSPGGCCHGAKLVCV